MTHFQKFVIFDVLAVGTISCVNSSRAVILCCCSIQPSGNSIVSVIDAFSSPIDMTFISDIFVQIAWRTCPRRSYKGRLGFIMAFIHSFIYSYSFNKSSQNEHLNIKRVVKSVAVFVKNTYNEIHHHHHDRVKGEGRWVTTAPYMTTSYIRHASSCSDEIAVLHLANFRNKLPVVAPMVWGGKNLVKQSIERQLRLWCLHFCKVW